MVQILPEVPSFGTQLARGLGGGIGQGLSQATQLALQLMGERRKNIDKNLSALPSTIQKYVKDLGYKETLARDPKKLAQLNEMTRKLVSQGQDPTDALNSIFPAFLSEGKKGSPLRQQEASAPESKAKLSFLPGTEERPTRPESGLLQGMKGRPDVALKAAPASAAHLVEGLVPLLPLAQQKSPRLTSKQLLSGKEPWKSEKYFRTHSEILTEKLTEGMTPEEKEMFHRDVQVQTLAPSLALAAADIGPAVAEGISGLRAARGTKGAPKIPTEAIPREATAPRAEIGAPEDIKPSLQGRVSKEVAETPTEMRIERTEPETRIYNRLENANLREQQVKIFPQYESEIAADAAARASREESRRPKTAVGEASQASRMVEAERALPDVRKAYENSIGRVRALEDEMVKLTGAQRETAETLLQLAQRDLENAEFELIQTLNNARTGERRVGIPQMEKAAQEKVLKIADQIANGEEIKLAKMDYSPEMIAEANRISKSKKLPARRTDDFYTLVHDAYANQYKGRLAQIEQEIAAAMKDKSMASLYNRQQLGKEKEALNKMIKSAEAENAIHRHKIALREISNRQKAQERFARLKKAEGGDKTSKLARERMWKERIEEGRTPQERAQVIDEAVEQIAIENPKASDQIKKEGGKLGEAFKKVREEAEKLNPDSVKKASNAKDAAKKARNMFDKLIDDISAFRSNFPYIWRTDLGKDLIFGIAGAIWDEVKKEVDMPLTSGSIIALMGGGRYGRYGRRQVINQIAKWGIAEWQIGKAKAAYERNDEAEFSKFTSSIRKKARERSSGF